MKIPESWLRSFVDPDWSSERLASELTMAGLEVEETNAFAPPFERIVVAEVRSATRHPQADKLSVCEVFDGQEVRQIVCGAPNVAAGLRVPCALPGAVLPGGLTIAATKLRGVDSNGMLCSARELGISEDHAGLLELPADAPVGSDVRAYLDLDDPVHLLKLTPNLAHCLSVVGVAREVAALSGAPLQLPNFDPAPVSIDERLPVRIEAADLCGRFSGRVIRGVDARAPTPEWMKRRLEHAGQRPISALVDISNYVMLELGRPTHVFDLGKIRTPLVVRWARPGERLELLSGRVVTLDPGIGIIADGEEVESIAGIMGGERTAVTLDITDVYLEAAFWWPEAIAGRTRQLNFVTDAAHRFERGVDAATTAAHLEYLSRLVLEICGGQAGPLDDQIVALPERPALRLRTERAAKVIGARISDAEIADIFRRLGLEFAQQPGSFEVNPPSYRFDLQIEEDLIEEVARIWGFDHLPQRPPVAPSPMLACPEGRRSALTIKQLMAARDFQEVINYSFVDSRLDAQLSQQATVRLLNPIASNLDVMRTTLLGGLIDNLRANLNRKASRVRLFEIGRVFRKDPSVESGPLAVDGIAQPRHLAALAYGDASEEQWGLPSRWVDFFDLKGDLVTLAPEEEWDFAPAAHSALHPGRAARVSLRGQEIGWIGELHPALQQQLELPRPVLVMEIELEPLLESEIPVAGELSKFPPVIRDLALVVADSVPAAEVIAAIRSAALAEPVARNVKYVKLFDEYRGKGLENKEKSLALRIWMQDTDRTLDEAQVTQAMQAIVARVAAELGARLR